LQIQGTTACNAGSLYVRQPDERKLDHSKNPKNRWDFQSLDRQARCTNNIDLSAIWYTESTSAHMRTSDFFLAAALAAAMLFIGALAIPQPSETRLAKLTVTVPRY
jgi:hypothetical protein